MCRKFGLFAVLLLLNLMSSAWALDTTITWDDENHWFVKFESQTNMKRIAFQRSPNHTRAKRWIALDEGFQIIWHQQQEFVVRKDGRPFQSVTFKLTPTYTHLPKEYAPFSPFSDGSMLFHSGRFFACENDCAAENQHFRLTLSMPMRKVAIVQGKLHKKQVTWVDAGEGAKIYVGSQMPIETPYFFAVIDEKLPRQLKRKLANELPPLIDYFASKLTAPPTKPMLFAGYAATQNGAYGSQGGVLPNQVFMYWYGEKAVETVDDNQTMFFFAHEVAHLFQGDGVKIDSLQESWVHEGSADLMAGTAMSVLDEDNQAYFLSKLAEARVSCLANVDGKNFLEALAGNTRLAYHCGLVLHHAILQSAMQEHQQLSSIFEIWTLFNAQIRSGASISAASYLQTVEPYIEASLHQQLGQLLSSQHRDAKPILSTILPK